MPEYFWKCPNKQGSEYTPNAKYAKILNIAKFWIWQGCQYWSLTQRSEYPTILLNMVE